MIGERFSERDCLGALVLVMRESQILTTSMQIETLAKQVEAHHHTFTMPAGASVPPW